MSKRSRRARPGNQPASQSGTRPPGPPVSGSGSPSGATVSSGATKPVAAATTAAATTPSSTRPAGARAGRRERARPVARKSFFERYRLLIVGVVGVAAIALITAWAFSSASAAAFSCSTEWVPDPTASPEAGASPQPGYHQEGMGNTHVGAGTSNPGELPIPTARRPAATTSCAAAPSRLASTARTTSRCRRAGSTTWSMAGW